MSYMYLNLPRNAIIRLSHSWDWDSQSQETFLALPAEKQYWFTITKTVPDNTQKIMLPNYTFNQEAAYAPNLTGILRAL